MKLCREREGQREKDRDKETEAAHGGMNTYSCPLMFCFTGCETVLFAGMVSI